MTNRRSIRKQGHDYASAGHYFVTLCVRNRDPLLGDIVDKAMRLSDQGKIVREEWLALPRRFPTVRLDAFTIMPNHMHGIVTIVGVPLAGTPSVDQPHGIDTGDSHPTASDTPTDRAGASPAPTLGAIIGAFKSLSDRRCRTTTISGRPDHRFGRLWQRATMTESSSATMNWRGSERTLRAMSQPGETIPITFNGMIHFAKALTDSTNYFGEANRRLLAQDFAPGQRHWGRVSTLRLLRRLC